MTFKALHNLIIVMATTYWEFTLTLYILPPVILTTTLRGRGTLYCLSTDKTKAQRDKGIAQAQSSSQWQSQDWSWVCVNSTAYALTSRLLFQHLRHTLPRQPVLQLQGWGHQTNMHTPTTTSLKDPFHNFFLWESLLVPLPHKSSLLLVGVQSSDHFHRAVSVYLTVVHYRPPSSTRV